MSDHKPTYHEQSEPFVYAEDNLQPTVINDSNITKLLEFMLYYLMTDKNPRAKLAALCFASGMNVGLTFGCDNTQAAIAKKLSIDRPHFSMLIKQVEKEFGLKNFNIIEKRNE